MTTQNHRCGYVALVGRPNVGKSTLLNRILGQKISITSNRPQTTRHRIHGIKTEDTYQAIYVDTPGIHHGRKAMSRYLNKAATSALTDVDLVLFLVEGTRWTEEDSLTLERLSEVRVPVVLVINKVDQVDKDALLPHLQNIAAKRDFAAVVPLSAQKGDNVEALEAEVAHLLPENEPFFPEDQVTDKSMRFIAAELIREKLTRLLGQELPYALTVEIEQYSVEPELVRVAAVIWVERDGQKSIVIGKGGAMLKKVGQQARQDMEKMLEQKVFMRLWVKVKEGWSADERSLRSLGYGDDPA